MTRDMQANYALLTFSEHLGDSVTKLDVSWAEFVGNRSSQQTFTVPTTHPEDPYVALQIFDVSEYSHEILINDTPLSGFDIPPADGWQYWMDTITKAVLSNGMNTIQFVRDAETDDNFVIGSVTVHWKEPCE